MGPAVHLALIQHQAAHRSSKRCPGIGSTPSASTTCRPRTETSNRTLETQPETPVWAEGQRQRGRPEPSQYAGQQGMTAPCSTTSSPCRAARRCVCSEAQIPQYDVGCVVSWRTRNLAAGMRPGSAQV